MTHASLQAALFVAAMIAGPAWSLETAPPEEASATSPADIDCQDVHDLESKEACYSRLPAAAIEECEALRSFTCAPYRDMHIAAGMHSAALEALVATSRTAYASYSEGDATYVADLVDRLQTADHAWQRWRDAQCSLEPFIEGMSRDEAEGLTEACRAGMTLTRAEQLRAQARTLEESP